MEFNKDNNDFENITFDTLPAAVEVILKTVKRLEAENYIRNYILFIDLKGIFY